MQVRFSNKSTVCVFNEPSLTKEQESNLWYSTEETDGLKAWHARRVQYVRSQLEDQSDLLNEGGVTINAAAILGLEKYLTPELTDEYKQDVMPEMKDMNLQKTVTVPRPSCSSMSRLNEAKGCPYQRRWTHSDEK
eukprot:scaffold4619_cov146-Skeletonema_menzelii.AAC.6